MQVNHVVELMQLKSFFGADTLEELCDLIEEYPYFQTARLLYALSLKENNDEKYHSELRKTSCYIGDRKQLLIRIEEGFHPFIEKMEEERSKNIPRSSFDLINFYLSNEVEEEEETELPILSKQSENTENSQNIDALLSDYVMYALNDDDESSDKDTIFFKYQEVIDRFLEKDKESPVKIEFKEETTTEEVEVIEKEEIIPEKEIIIPVDKQDETVEIPENRKEEIIEVEIEEEKILQEEEKEEVVVKQEVPVEGIKSFDKILDEIKPKENVPLLKYQDIIDKFIEEDKNALPIKINLKEDQPEKKKETKKPAVLKRQKTIKTPVDENKDTAKSETSATEAMAKMYLQQKKYDKALEIITELSLINPEKKRYFADQIRFLEKVITNTKK